MIATDDALAERLVGCLHAATFEMETLCRLAGVATTRRIDSAAVECLPRPRLLLNPDFVERWCRTDEHLFLLAMHELYHVILGHTRLYPRVTEAQNIAYDAVINAMLMRQFGDAQESRGFFEALNPPDLFPALLLRPPEGWPRGPRYPDDVEPSGRVGSLVRRLYPPDTNAECPMPTYLEILELIEAPSRAGGTAAAGGGAVLVGDHGDPEEEQRILDDPVVGDIVRRIVARWPPPPSPLGGRDLGGAPSEWLAALGPSSSAARRAFADALRRALGPRPGRETRRTRALVVDQGARGVLPNARDRTAPARRRLGLAPTLWVQASAVRARVPDVPSIAHVYLDVSGSMTTLLPRLIDLLVPYVAGGRARLFQFSTVVAPLGARDLQAGRLTTTMGTDIGPVLRHVLDARVRRVLVLTDGYTGRASGAAARMLADRRVRMHVVLPSESAWRRDLAPVAASMTVLPSLWRA